MVSEDKSRLTRVISTRGYRVNVNTSGYFLEEVKEVSRVGEPTLRHIGGKIGSRRTNKDF